MLRRLALRDFRNFEKLDVAVPEHGLVIVGENGHGKTNLLEAVAYLGLFRSVRGARDSDAIRFGAAAFHVRAELSAPSRFDTVSVGYERSTKRKRATVDGVEQERLSIAFGALPSVCFSPADVALVAGGPAERRHFLDVALAMSAPGYLSALQKYRSALRQRNAALRLVHRAGANARSVSNEASVAVWEPLLSTHGGALAASRRRWCESNGLAFTSICEAIGERATVTLRYSGIDAGTDAPQFVDAYQLAFDEQRANELRRGVTLVGPHRDDVHLSLGSHDLRTFGSAGQQRTAAIALRMLELSTVRQSIGSTPLLLLDDPFAELDAKRSMRILSLLEESGVGQVLLAVPREEDIPDSFTRLARRRMVNGELL